MSQEKDRRSVDDAFRGLAGLHPSRREFLLYVGTLVAASACGSERGSGAAAPPPAPPLASNPFTLGLASGDPLPDSVILWTRLALDPIHGGGMPDEDVPVSWEVSLDDRFDDIVISGWLMATPALGHSVHVDADGLAADSWYYYRFHVGDQWTSPVGRTRTLPALDSSPASFRIGLASCQNYRQGYYHAHGLLADEDIDLVLFVGDYIYESGVGELDEPRQHEASTPQTVEQYRNRYATYKTDPNLLAAHASCPWVTTWDDHEVANNYAGLVLGDKPTDEVLALRTAAYQAYYEHQPLRIPLPDDFGYMQIYRDLEIGDLAKVWVLDTRQYRSPQACGGGPGPICAESLEPGRTLLGPEQKQWLKDGLQQSDKLWNVVAQQVVFNPIKFNRALLNPDQWDGYPVERQELLDLFGTLGNVLVLSGDIHAAGFAELKADAADQASETIAYEVVTTSISSGGDLALGSILDLILPQNPHIHHLNASKRGFAICEIGRDKLRVTYRIVDSVITAETTTWTTDAEFEVDRATLEFVRL